MKTFLGLHTQHYLFAPQIALFRLFGMLFVLVACPVKGQVLTQKKLTEKDYALWSTLQVDQLSAKGNWVSYQLKYESGNDTLFVKHTQNTKQYFFAKSFDTHFKDDSYFTCLQVGKGLVLLDLDKGKQQVFPSVISYSFSEGNDYLILQCQNEIGATWVEIRNFGGTIVAKLDGVSHYVQQPSGTQLLCVIEGSEASIILFDLKTLRQQVIIKSSSSDYTDVVWDKNGSSFAFIATDKNRSEANTKSAIVCYYSLKKKELLKFESQMFADFPTEMAVQGNSNVALTISDDGQRVFFGMKSVLNHKATKDDIQVWNSDDTWLYPIMNKIDHWNAVAKVGVWFPKEHRFQSLTSNELPMVILDGKQTHAITYNPSQNKTLGAYDDLMDFYISDLQSGSRKLFLPEQSNEVNRVLISPAGKYVLYFKNKDWYVYDISIDKHINITKDLPTSFVESTNHYFEIEPSGAIGWTPNDEAVLLYDDYDIWKVQIGTTAERLTKGREQKIQFRLYTDDKHSLIIPNFNGYSSQQIPLDKGLLLTASSEDTMSHGYSTWDAIKGTQPLVYEVAMTDQLIRAENSSTSVYREQYYDFPPMLMVQKANHKSSKILVESNTQHYHYLQSKSQLIRYTTSKGTSLKAALFYPAGYDSTKKYPMIVSIYQRQSESIATYVNPTEYNSIGFNIAHFVSKGYFVLLPDIDYELGIAGKSATDCVVAATTAVIEKGLVDPKRIGLIGHSFGGYQTNFIITQTNLFAAAISGSGFTDLVNGYFTVGWNKGTPEFWRYEKQQVRIGKSFYENKQAYVDNSPIWQAQKVQTPLFSWTGEQDKQIPYSQTISYHLALRRLNKKNVMVLYPNEAHALEDKEHQKDLMHRIEDWFGYYLKKEPPKGWIGEGVK